MWSAALGSSSTLHYKAILPLEETQGSPMIESEPQLDAWGEVERVGRYRRSASSLPSTNTYNGTTRS